MASAYRTTSGQFIWPMLNDILKLQQLTLIYCPVLSSNFIEYQNLQNYGRICYIAHNLCVSNLQVCYVLYLFLTCLYKTKQNSNIKTMFTLHNTLVMLRILLQLIPMQMFDISCLIVRSFIPLIDLSRLNVIFEQSCQ